MERTMPIDATEFGAIIVDGKTYGHDVIIRLSGNVEKRRKRLSKGAVRDLPRHFEGRSKVRARKRLRPFGRRDRPGRERSPVAGGERLFRQERLSGRAAADPRCYPDL